MIKSMTGYGRASYSSAGRKMTVEIKSLNAKQSEIYTRLPQHIKEKDIELRTLVVSILERGKFDLNIHTDEEAGEAGINFNRNLASKYFEEIKSFYDEKGMHVPDETLLHILRLPDVMSGKEVMENDEWEELKNSVKSACLQLDEFRRKEGSVLFEDLGQRIKAIENLLAEIAPFEEERMAMVRNRLMNDLRTVSEKAGIDANRFEQELIYYLEKIDFTEEKVRLKNHCDYFMKTMNEETSNGRKLGFITQEIGREINTIGSKANHSLIQQVVVRMKDELEKIKEQLFNIL